MSETDKENENRDQVRRIFGTDRAPVPDGTPAVPQAGLVVPVEGNQPERQDRPTERDRFAARLFGRDPNGPRS